MFNLNTVVEGKYKTRYLQNTFALHFVHVKYTINLEKAIYKTQQIRLTTNPYDVIYIKHFQDIFQDKIK